MKQLTIWMGVLLFLTVDGILSLQAAHVNPTAGFSPAILLIAYAPSVAALLAAAIVLGKTGVWQLVRQVGRWRTGVWWYVLVLAAPLVIVALAHLLYGLGHGGQAGLALDYAGLGVAVGSIVAGSLGEEFGWRGLAQPLLQKRFTILRASIIVGILWATWHCWSILAPGGLQGNWQLDVALTYLRLVPTAIIYGWLYNVSKGNLLLVMVAHAGHNIAVSLLPISVSGGAVATVVACMYAGLAAALVACGGFHNLPKAAQ